MRVAVETRLRVGDAHDLEQLDAALAHLVLGHVGIVDEQGLGDLLADGEDRRQGGQRVLEHHGR